MFLTDILPETPLTIYINYDKQILEFSTVAVRSVTGGLLVEPITQNNLMINFVEKYNILYQLTFVNDEDNRLYKWNKITIKAVKDAKGQSYHMLISELEGHPYNRRESFRVPLDLEGIARFGPNRMTHKITVKNISAGGIGFECKNNVEIQEEMLVHLSFEDPVLHTNFKVDCQAVRKLAVEDSENTYYGCKFLKESMAINNYVQRKQQRLLIKNNPNYKEGISKRIEAMRDTTKWISEND